MDNIKEKLKSQNIVSTIFSFFHISKVLKITKLSKKYQEILSLHKDLFKMNSYFNETIKKNLNMGAYYDYFIYKYPHIGKERMLDLFILFLQHYSENNKIYLNTKHHLSKTIINSIEKNCIVLTVTSPHFVNDDFCIGNAKSVYKVKVERTVKLNSEKRLNAFFDKCTNNNVKKLHYYTLNMYSDECCDLLKKRIIALTNLIRFKTDAFIDYDRIMKELIQKKKTLDYIDISIQVGENTKYPNIKQIIDNSQHITKVNLELNEEHYKMSKVLPCLDGISNRIEKLIVFGITQDDSNITFDKFVNLRELRISGIMDIGNIMYKLPFVLPNLRKLSLIDITFDYNAFMTTLTNSPLLENIVIDLEKIQELHQKEKDLANKMSSMKSLKYLQLTLRDQDSTNAFIEEFKSDSLETLYCNSTVDINMTILLKNCKSLQEFTFSNLSIDEYVEEGEEHEYIFDFPSQSSLKKLSLLNIQKLAEDDIKTISKYESLTQLEIHDLIIPDDVIEQFSDGIVSMKKIEKLILKINTEENALLLKNSLKKIISNLSSFEFLSEFSFNCIEYIDSTIFEDLCLKAKDLKLLSQLALDINIDDESKLKILNKYRDNFVNLTTLDVPIYEIPQSLTDTQKDFLAKYEETFEGNVDDYN